VTARSPKGSGPPMEAWPWRGRCGGKENDGERESEKRKSPQWRDDPREVFRVRRPICIGDGGTASKNHDEQAGAKRATARGAELRGDRRSPRRRIAAPTIIEESEYGEQVRRAGKHLEGELKEVSRRCGGRWRFGAQSRMRRQAQRGFFVCRAGKKIIENGAARRRAGCPRG